MLYGEDGDAENPTGGVIGAIADTMSKLDDLSDSAGTNFGAAA
jgi:hypothetical protein